MALGTPRLTPPLVAPLVDEATGAPSAAWIDHHTGIADQLADLRASQGRGATDGSDAAAGFIGEYLTATGTVSLSSGAATTVVTLPLPAGDFDVWGSVKFTPAAGTTSSHLLTAIGATKQELFMAVPAGTGGASLTLATGMPARFNGAGAQTATLVAVANHSGSMTGDGRIVARRAR